MSFRDLGATSNAVAELRAVQPSGREGFRPSGGVACSSQSAAAMFLARVLPSGPKPFSRGPSQLMRGLLGWFFAAVFAVVSIPQSFAVLADAGHRPFNFNVPNFDGSAEPRRQFREPYVEVSNNPASPTTVTIYSVVRKFNNPGYGTANQTGGALFYKGAADGVWQQAALSFHANEGEHQYWKASFSSAAFDANEVIQYYLYLTFDSGAENTYIYAPTGLGDLNSATTNSQSAAASFPFTVRNRPAWIFHANNRVINGTNVQFWAKAGYIGDPNNLATRWADNAAVYYTTNGSDPVPGATPGQSGAAATQVAFLNYDHPETSGGGQGGTSIAGTAMWWMANVANMPGSTTIKYKIGFWHSSNSEQKFADHNAATNNQIFSFSIGGVGDPVLTINGLNANYTTTHLFVDEVAATSQNLTVSFQPNAANINSATVQVFTNLNRRDRAQLDANGDGTEDGIMPPDGNSVGTDDANYYRAYPMTNDGGGSYSLVLNAAKTGAYRLSARYQTTTNPGVWVYYTMAGRRDHAIVVSPVDARNINLYEMNVLNVEADGDQFANRGTLEDLYDAPNAPHGTGNSSRWHLNYLLGLGCNWLWFQPIHPITLEAQQGFDPGSPYSVRNFFEINPLMSVNYNSAGGPTDQANRDAARLAFTGLVSAADAAGVGIMLDAPYNHSAPDCEVSAVGAPIFGLSASALFRDVEARFYSQSGNYAARATNSGNIAIAPDRGDFGKWGDVRDVFFGNYSALVAINPQDNGNYNNESDVFDYSNPNWTSDDSGAPGFQNVTRNVWKYFAEYTLHWLGQTGVPPGADLATQTAHGIDGLRADFGQGLPPQFWEYAINKTRTRKWNFVFMAESLDGGAVTYRSNRHFDVLNENIVFPLKSASTSVDYRNIFEGRRAAYGQSLVLLNNTSHDEESYTDPWQAVVRYAVCGAIDGVPLIFPGQELGISRTFGYQQYEINFGKQIAHFKRYNSMMPAWNDNDYGNNQLYPVYQGIGQARLFSRALRSSNRYFLDQTGLGGIHASIFAVAKYETKNAGPAFSDVVFAFANIDRDNNQSGNFNVNQDTDNNGVNDYGIKVGRTYNVRNIAAYEAIDTTRRDVWLWGAAGRSGSDVLNSGVFVSVNKVPTMQSSMNSNDPAWNQRPYEAQYLKVYDVTAPPNAPGTPMPPNSYNYTIGSSVTVTWTPAAPDSEGIQPWYKVNYSYNNGAPGFFYTSSTSAMFGISPGSHVQVWIQSVNPNNLNVTGASSPTVLINFLEPSGDNDGDGKTNADEDAASTNPFDATSHFGVSQITKPDANNVTVSWQSVSGKKYKLEGSSTVAGSYTPIEPEVTANASTTSLTVPTGGFNFFRVRIVP